MGQTPVLPEETVAEPSPRDATPTVAGRPLPSAERYSRQVLFPGIGARGQERLAGAGVAIVGIGATGATAAALLARAGVGRLTLVDRDFVEPSNLQRQMLFDERDARDALPKAEAAARHLRAINGEVVVTRHIADLTPANIADLLRGVALVLDCTDNFETRYLLNEWAVHEARPWIYTAAVGATAAGMNILPRALGDQEPPWAPTACLACIFPAAPLGEVDTCETAGVLGPAVTLAAAQGVAEAFKFLTGHPGLMRRSFVSHDLWTGDRAEIATGSPRPDCAVCGLHEFRALAGQGRPHITLCGRNSVQIHEHHRPVDLGALATRLAPLGEVRSNGLLLRFQRAPYTLTVFPDGRALIQGTTDPGQARSLYARFVGS